jgi:tetratricopeptide (TPR) repeat protein
VLSNLANALMQTGRISQGTACLDKALEKYPDYVPALIYRGVVLLREGADRGSG